MQEFVYEFSVPHLNGSLEAPAVYLDATPLQAPATRGGSAARH
jgi:hypothetical protein